MYCMACNQHLDDNNPDMFMFRFEGKPPIIAHACDPKDLPADKLKKYKTFGDDPTTSAFVINGKKYFGQVIED